MEKNLFYNLFLTFKKGEPANVLYLTFDILILLAIPFRFVNFSEESSISAQNVEDAFLILAIPCGWCHMLFYARF